jgi:hypothetical protein
MTCFHIACLCHILGALSYKNSTMLLFAGEAWPPSAPTDAMLQWIILLMGHPG